MNDQSFKFHPEFFFRSPSLAFQNSIILEKDILEIANKKEFQEAIYIASPVLFNEIQAWLSGKLEGKKDINKLIYSLYKYYTRFFTRCTPYGLFATCSTGYWGKENTILLSDSKSFHARFDMDFVCQFAQQINNLVENVIRPVALGRKNYLFAGSHEAAQRSAMLYSFMGTCKLRGVEPLQWLKTTLTKLPDHKANRLHELLPC
jgi:hypothetical protein